MVMAEIDSIDRPHNSIPFAGIVNKSLDVYAFT